MSLASQIADFADAIRALSSVVEAALSQLATPFGVIALLLFILWLLVNFDYSRMFVVLEHKQRRRLEQINEYVSLPDLNDSTTIKAVSDQRDTHYFTVATGIYAEGHTRNALVEMHQAISHLVTWTHIRRAFEYIKVAADQTITIRDLTKFEQFGYRYNQFVAFISFLFSAVLGSIFILSDIKTWNSFALSFGGSVVAVLFAMFASSQNWPIQARNRIAKELKCLREKSNDAESSGGSVD